MQYAYTLSWPFFYHQLSAFIFEFNLYVFLLASTAIACAVELCSRSIEDDVRSDAHHYRGGLGWSSEDRRWGTKWVGAGGQLRAVDGQHVGREGQAAGVPPGDPGDAHTLADQAAGRAAREGRTSEANQCRATSGERLSLRLLEDACIQGPTNMSVCTVRVYVRENGTV